MKISCGTDLTDISRIEKAYARHGEAFLRRYMSEAELSYCRLEDGTYRLASAAAFYAAKEALAKALGTGIACGVRLREIEVLHDEAGAPFYRLSGGAEARFRELGFDSLSLSLTHDGGLALAFCTIYAA